MNIQPNEGSTSLTTGDSFVQQVIGIDISITAENVGWFDAAEAATKIPVRVRYGDEVKQFEFAEFVKLLGFAESK